jgi:hypothetical protein
MEDVAAAAWKGKTEGAEKQAGKIGKWSGGWGAGEGGAVELGKRTEGR